MTMIQKIMLCLCAGACVATFGCARSPVKVSDGEMALAGACEQYGIAWEWDSVIGAVTLSYEDHRAKALVGSDIVHVDDYQQVLSAPVRRYRGAIIVPLDFKQKVIERLLTRMAPPATRFRTVMLDPGHGGKDPGAIGVTGLQEKAVNLAIAQLLKEALEKQGMTVRMTRDTDVFIPLERRVQLAHEAKADLFISIHAHASRSRSAH